MASGNNIKAIVPTMLNPLVEGGGDSEPVENDTDPTAEGSLTVGLNVSSDEKGSNLGASLAAIGEVADDNPSRRSLSAGGGTLVVPAELARQIDEGRRTADTLQGLALSKNKRRKLSGPGRALAKVAEFTGTSLYMMRPSFSWDMDDLFLGLIHIPISAGSAIAQAGLWLTHSLEKGIRGKGRVTGKVHPRDIKAALVDFEQATGASKVLIGRAVSAWLDSGLGFHPNARKAVKDVRDRTFALPERDHERADGVAAALDLLGEGEDRSVSSAERLGAMRDSMKGLEGQDLAFVQGLFRGTLPERELSPDYVVLHRDRSCVEQEARYLLGLDSMPDPKSNRAQHFLASYRALNEPKEKAEILMRGGPSAGLVMRSVIDTDDAPPAAMEFMKKVRGWDHIESGYSSYHHDERIFLYELAHVEKVEIAGEHVGYRAYMRADRNGYGQRDKHRGYVAFDLEGNQLGHHLPGDCL